MDLTLMNSWKLTTKFLVSILAALVLVFAASGLIISAHEKSILITEINGKGNNLSKFLAGISAEPILSFNFSYLENYVHDISAGDPDIAYAVIQDKDGNLLTHQKGRYRVQQPRSPEQRANRDGKNRDQHRTCAQSTGAVPDHRRVAFRRNDDRHFPDGVFFVPHDRTQTY